MDYSWPGNIRELEHAIEHAFILCHGRVITIEHLPEEIGRQIDRRDAAQPKAGSRAIQPDHILKTLARTGGNKAKAARLLGVDRRTLYRKIDKFNLDVPQ